LKRYCFVVIRNLDGFVEKLLLALIGGCGVWM
jgi:hypothetical protein